MFVPTYRNLSHSNFNKSFSLCQHHSQTACFTVSQPELLAPEVLFLATETDISHRIMRVIRRLGGGKHKNSLYSIRLAIYG
jgi:hypothetical protein